MCLAKCEKCDLVLHVSAVKLVRGMKKHQKKFDGHYFKVALAYRSKD